MEKWMTTEEIIEGIRLSKINIIANVLNGNLTAYDNHNFEPVSLDSMKQQFEEIVAMSSKKIIGTKFDNVKTTSKYTGEEHFNYAEIKTDIAPLIIQPDEWTDKNGTHRTSFVPWGVLHNRLSQKVQTKISLSQYDIILKGWGGRQIEEIVLQSVFLEADILEITGQGQGDQPPTGAKESPQRVKASNNLLKVIGALVQIHYLEAAKPNSRFVKGDGSVNAKTVSEDIHEGLRRAGIENFAGLEDSSLRNKIKEGLSALAKNRV